MLEAVIDLVFHLFTGLFRFFTDLVLDVLLSHFLEIVHQIGVDLCAAVDAVHDLFCKPVMNALLNVRGKLGVFRRFYGERYVTVFEQDVS